MAVVDLGTITTRLLIVDADGRPIVRVEPVTEMGASISETGRIGSDGLARVEAALIEHRSRIDAAGVTAIRALATSAAREAGDQADLAALVRQTLRVELEILDGHSEGRLAFEGATTALRSADPTALFVVLDIGGGSTEFAYGNDADGVLGVVSIDVGASRITKEYLASDPPEAAELSAALSVIELHLDDVVRESSGILAAIDSGTVIGVGGTISTVGAVELGLRDDDRSLLEHFVLSIEAVEDVFRTLATEPRADRGFNPGLPANRVDLIVGGCCILVETMRHLEIDEVLVSERDLLDGAAAALQAGQDAR